MSTEKFTIILQILPGSFVVFKLAPEEIIPGWLLAGQKFFSITKTEEELSIVCEQSSLPKDMEVPNLWRMFKIKGQMDFDLVGILRQVLNPLAENNIGIFALSTFNTDYVLVQEKDFDKATKVLSDKFID